MNEHEVENSSLDDPSGEEVQDQLERYANLSLLGIGTLALLMLLIYFLKFSGMGFSEDQTHWGVLGDYIGGVLNPAISLAALYWLTRSIIIQRKELQESREALRATAYSQAQQAKSSEIAAKLQLLSIELEIISSQLAVETSYRMQVLASIGDSDFQQKIYDREGEFLPAKDVLDRVSKDISLLSSRREGVLRASQNISPGFKIEIMLAKSL